MSNRSAYHSIGLLTATAAIAIFGGLHLEDAAGRNLDTLTPNDARLQTSTTLAATGINRLAKADRHDVSQNAAKGRTLTFQLPELPSTTVAVRIWEAVGMTGASPPVAGKRTPNGEKRRQTVACEGVVSALTEVAKHLEPGRCIT